MHLFKLEFSSFPDKCPGVGLPGLYGKSIFRFFFFLFVYIFFFFFKSFHVACAMLIPQPGIEPMPLAVKVQGPNHWTTREFPFGNFLTGMR